MNKQHFGGFHVATLSAFAMCVLGAVACGPVDETATDTQGQAQSVTVRRPFPQHATYAAGARIPNHVTRAQLDSGVRAFYDAWKKQYVTALGTDQYYIHASTWQPDAVSVSEGHGFGMMTVALMAGYDPAAQKIYDGMYRFYRAHAGADPQLMGWYQKQQNGAVVNGDAYNATDGDFDIAQSLLVADAQWGSSGSINYRSEAQKAIAAIMAADINHKYWSVMRGSTGQTSQDSRPSDYMPDHFVSFAAATGDANWNKVVTTSLNILSTVQKNNSSVTGLFPDFVVNVGTTAAPSPANRFESADDGQFYWNACRVPWRLAAAYALSGDSRIAAMLGTVNAFIRKQSGQDPGRIAAGYSLNGKPIDQYAAMAFIAPMAVSAMVGAENQSWLNSLWDRVVATDIASDEYFGNNIKMLALIALSGNYWAP